MKVLDPNSKAPMTSKYEAAWNALRLENLEDKSHAKCWLTYRACDGQITLADWHQHVAVNAIVHRTERWRVSQSLAEFFLARLNDDLPWMDDAAAKVETVDLQSWPDGISHLCRLESIRAFAAYVQGDHDQCLARIKNALGKWKETMGALDVQKFPTRFLEIRTDLHAINFLILLAVKIGYVEEMRCLYDWIHASIATQKSTPWYRCLRKIAGEESHGIFPPDVDQGSMVPQYRTVHEQKHYGHGPGEQERDTIRAAIVEAIGEPNSVLDYGCGNSKLSSQMFPTAAVLCRYDPAIERLSVLPSMTFEAGICTDVLEHVPESELPDLVARFKALAPTWYFTIHTGPAAQLLPDGQNAHCTQHPPEWWQGLLGGKIVWSKGQRFGLLVTW